MTQVSLRNRLRFELPGDIAVQGVALFGPFSDEKAALDFHGSIAAACAPGRKVLGGKGTLFLMSGHDVVGPEVVAEMCVAGGRPVSPTESWGDEVARFLSERIAIHFRDRALQTL